jgi:hypothetical protein
MDNISCITNPNVTVEETFVARKKLCDRDETLCFGGTFNSTEGRFGSYLMCNLTESASWTQQQNYIAHNNDSAACSSAGGVMQKATPLASLASDCRVLLRQAGPDGKGTITFTPSSVPTDSSSFVPSNKGDLNTGARVGIGVSIGGFVILCVSLGFYLRARRQNKTVTSPTPEDDFRKAELPDTFIQRADKVHTLIDSNEIRELSGTEVPVHIGIGWEVVEANTEYITELPTPHNERAELDVRFSR